MHNYLGLVKQQVKDNYAVIIIDNSDTASKKRKALSEIWDDSTGELIQGCLTIEAVVLSKKGKMSFPVYEKVFSIAKKEAISENRENFYAVLSPSLKTSAQNVSALLTAVLTPMTITTISKYTGSVLSSVLKRTKISFITERPAIS